MSRARDIADSASTINALDNVTASGAELNILDGVTSTTAELNILDGVTATATEINKLDGVSRGSLIYGNASAETALLTKGSANQVLTSDGTDIAWANAAAGGTSGMQVLSTVTASDSSTVDLETTFDSTYDEYIITITGVRPANDTDDLFLQVKQGGSYSTSGYMSSHVYSTVGGSSHSYETSPSTVSGITIGRYLGVTDATESANFYVRISNVHSTAVHKLIYANGVTKNASGSVVGGESFGRTPSTYAVTGVRFKMTVGNISSGVFRLYGVAKS